MYLDDAIELGKILGSNEKIVEILKTMVDKADELYKQKMSTKTNNTSYGVISGAGVSDQFTYELYNKINYIFNNKNHLLSFPNFPIDKMKCSLDLSVDFESSIKEVLLSLPSPQRIEE